MLKYVVGVLLAVGSSGCSSQYFKATSAFANTASEGLSTFSGAIDLNASICHKRARFDYLYRRLNERIVQEKRTITWVTFETSFRYPGTGGAEGETWSQHCAHVERSDALVGAAITGLGAYAKALGAIADGDYQASDLKSLLDSATSLASGLGASSKTANTAKSLVAPLSRLAGYLAQEHARSECAAVVKEADADVTAILDGIQGYFQSVAMEAVDSSASLDNVLKLADDRLDHPSPSTPAPALSSADVLVLSDLATRWSDDVAGARIALQSMQDALTKLKSAQRKLVAANGRNDAPELKELLGDLVTILGDVQRLRAALAGKDV